jgi:hypothetical protein
VLVFPVECSLHIFVIVYSEHMYFWQSAVKYCAGRFWSCPYHIVFTLVVDTYLLLR